MTGTTDLAGWPYPEASDLIAQGAAAIEASVEAIEGQFFLETNKLAVDAPWTSYPAGMSIMRVSGEGWPYTSGQVVTYRAPASALWVNQFFFRYSSGGTAVAAHLRQGWSVSGTPTWSKWDTVAGPGSPDAMAGGNVTITPKADEVSSVTVTFPTGRFQYAPAVFTQYRGGSPGVSTAPSNVTNTSFTLNVLRATASSTYVYWLAVGNQGE